MASRPTGVNPKAIIMDIAKPYFQEGVFPFGANNFLALAAIAADECPDAGFALKASAAQIMAAIAAEAFIDEFAFSLATLQKSNKATELARIGLVLQQLELSRVQITEKFQIASQLLPGEPLDPSNEPFQSFSQLIKLRNFLAHPKVLDKPPRWFAYFVSNNLILDPTYSGEGKAHWRYQIQCKSSARWACRATANIILHMIESIKQPCTIHNVPGTYESLWSLWEWAATDSRF